MNEFREFVNIWEKYGQNQVGRCFETQCRSVVPVVDSARSATVRAETTS